MYHYFLTGIAIGLLFGVPAGVVGAMTIQRTLAYGAKAGLVTGLGSSVADCFYAGVGAFGITIISDFLETYQKGINVAGGSLIVIMGLCMLFGKRKEEATAFPQGTKLFLSSFAVGITNPAAVLTFLFAFSYFGLGKQMGLLAGLQLVAGVFLGTYFWWGLLSAGTAVFQKKVKKDILKNRNRVFGILFLIFGAVIWLRTYL